MTARRLMSSAERAPPAPGARNDVTRRRVGEALWRLPQRLLLLGVRGYRLLLKPWLGNACRFEPSCSAYALQALERHGATAGAVLSAGRLLRCQPWCDGGCDPVPERLPRLFTRLGLGPRDHSYDDKKLS